MAELKTQMSRPTDLGTSWRISKSVPLILLLFSLIVILNNKIGEGHVSEFYPVLLGMACITLIWFSVTRFFMK